ncbi:MAG: tRNA preQ1(34) S-adenosylmethionine ribosyltransferase-isomerase QueA [Elusimicrobia bacterium]|nr:tRNA preQ1(34) S-adenosylmethionine ribosyltransferase-isomerase QueA [Candidatus Liberimonas magnetica]
METETDLLLASYDYTLPKELIAQKPLEKRDEAKLLVLGRHTGEITHRSFKDIADYLNPGDLLVINKTKVVPARIFGKRETGGRVEALFLNVNEADMNDRKALALLKPPIPLNKKIIFPDNLEAVVSGKNELGEYVIKLSGPFLKQVLSEYGQMPLPPYIKRDKVNNSPLKNFDAENYQTVYSKEDGSIASPTAGLHFTKELLKDINERGIEIIEVILHVGWGTFRPVKAQDITRHFMLPEHYSINQKDIDKIKEARKKGKKVFATGTTAVRALESAFSRGSEKSFGETDLFIHPGYKFGVVDALITNFHLPRSTPLLLVSSFASRKTILDAYKKAIQLSYRFYSYGDAMLIL